MRINYSGRENVGKETKKIMQSWETI